MCSLRPANLLFDTKNVCTQGLYTNYADKSRIGPGLFSIHASTFSAQVPLLACQAVLREYSVVHSFRFLKGEPFSSITLLGKQAVAPGGRAPIC